jgi:hypothetical protein
VKGENWAALAGGSLNQSLRLAVLKARICVIAELPLSTGEIRATAELEIDRMSILSGWWAGRRTAVVWQRLPD